MAIDLPDAIESEEQLDTILTQPDEAILESVRGLESPLVLLGAGGKMGPTLAVLAKRASEATGKPLRVIAASRFRNADARNWLEQRGVETLSVDLLNRADVDRLPDTRNLLYLVGMKFGTSVDPVPTWVTNTIAPMHISERYHHCRIVALSTGNVYPNVSVSTGGCREDHALTPIGEYANAAIARERLFQYYSRSDTQANPTALLRLNYAHDLRYGVLTDIATKVWREEPVSLDVGYFNAIWQGDANAMCLHAFRHCESPSQAINLTSPDIYSVREVAEQFGKMFGRVPSFTGTEQSVALLSNTDRMLEKLGSPSVTLEKMMRWIGHWIQTGGRLLNKPTHFETRDGKY